MGDPVKRSSENTFYKESRQRGGTRDRFVFQSEGACRDHLVVEPKITRFQIHRESERTDLLI